MQQETDIILTPAQARALQALVEGLASGDILTLQGRAGCGKSLILRQLHTVTGGVLVNMRELISGLAERQLQAIEESFLQMMEQALAAHDVVIVDDLHLVTELVDACDYPRAFLLDAALTAVLGEASALKKKLVFGMDGEAPWPIRRRAQEWTIEEFAAASG
jgi:hypothetical protein